MVKNTCNMEKKEKIKVSFSISVTKTYDEDDIEGYISLNPLNTRDSGVEDLKFRLKQMIIEDTINAINDGKGSFKILG